MAKGGTIRVFDFEVDTGGVRVVVRRQPLGRGCLSDGEVDADIRALKEDLDQVAQRMKAAIRKAADKPVFSN